MRIGHENIWSRIDVGVEHVPGKIQGGCRPLSVRAKEQRTKNQHGPIAASQIIGATTRQRQQERLRRRSAEQRWP